MCTKNWIFQWKSTPSKCYDVRSLRLDEEKSIFYTSFLLQNETYKLGDYVYFKISEEVFIGRLVCLYESDQHDNRFRGVLYLYKYAKDCDIKTHKRFIENEIIEDDVYKDISLHKVKGKCIVIIGTEQDTAADIDSSTHLLRYKLLNSSLVPLISNEVIKTTNVLNQFEKVLTPKCQVTSKFETISPFRIPYVKLCDSMKKARIAENFATPKKLSVCRNLNESFDSTPNSQEGTPVLNYSLIENSADNEKDVSLKIKLRLSHKQKPHVLIEKLNENEIDKYINKNKENVMDEVQGSLRRSCRAKQRVSYAEFDSTGLTPTKRGRKKSENFDSPIRDSLTPSKRKINDEEDGSPKKITRSSRKTRNSVKNIEVESPTYGDYDLHKTPSKRKAIDEEVTTRSTRKTRNSTPNRFKDYEVSPLTIPKKSILKQSTNNISTPKKSVLIKDDSHSGSIDFEWPKKTNVGNTPKKSDTVTAPITPKTPRNANVSTPKNSVKDTPSARAKLIREGMITPSVQSRATPVKVDKTPLNMAKSKLHVSYVPKILACREKEFNDVYNFVEGKLLDGCGGCMYISGVPGTGKTATVTEVIKKLHSQVKSRTVPDFEYVCINGMRLSEPRQSYVEILRQLTGKSVRWEQAQATLDTKFTKTGNKNKPIVLLVDELDILCTKRQDVVYNLLDWPTKAKAQLIVITIANTMDLPERLLMGRVTSRLGLTRLTFQAYTHKQLQEIVTRRLLGTDAFNPDAVQLVARKVASVSGDARRALDICRRAAEIAELEGDNTLVSMSHINNALNAMITQPKVQAIKHCSRLQQLVLQAIVAEVERTGVEETTFSDIYTMLISVAALDGFQMVTCTGALRAISRLGACRLLLTDQKSHDFNQKLILNVSSDDVYYALRKG